MTTSPQPYQPAQALPSGIATAAWIAPNPFGEPTSYLLVHPDADSRAGAALVATAESLGLKRLDEDGDIPWVPTERLVVALRGIHADLWAGPAEAQERWLSVLVPDAWTAAAVGRRYVVLVIGDAAGPEVMDAEAIAEYLTHPEQVRTGLVRIRLKVTED